jgi:hypothetical protein
MVVTRSRAQFWNKLASNKTLAEWEAENRLRAAAPSCTQPLAQRPVSNPSPPKQCPVSENGMFTNSTEQKLAEALAEITELKKSNVSLRGELNTLTAENAELKTKNTGFTDTVKYLEKEVDSWKEQHKLEVDRCNRLVDRCNQLHERIVNPFKSAISRPRF